MTREVTEMACQANRKSKAVGFPKMLLCLVKLYVIPTAKEMSWEPKGNSNHTSSGIQFNEQPASVSMFEEVDNAGSTAAV